MSLGHPRVNRKGGGRGKVEEEGRTKAWPRSSRLCEPPEDGPRSIRGYNDEEEEEEKEAVRQLSRFQNRARGACAVACLGVIPSGDSFEGSQVETGSVREREIQP